ncbi:MAG: hypothetical protein ACM3W4_08605 [Ignavibacteriales bacterium]
MAQWLERFRFYRHPPDEAAIRAWLGRFKEEHQPIAMRVLDAVVVIPEVEIQQGYKDALDSLPGWSRDKAHRQGRWYFVGFGGAGESGVAMLRTFREANNLTNSMWDPLFCMPRDLPKLRLSAYDRVVFVDDFSGSGKQVCSYWPLMQELVASEATCYLVLTAATAAALGEIQRKTELQLRTRITLPEAANIFSEESNLFGADEKAVLVEYGGIAWRAHPKGFGGCGLLFVLSHKTPNNSIPILYVNHQAWVGLFPRNLLAA